MRYKATVLLGSDSVPENQASCTPAAFRQLKRRKWGVGEKSEALAVVTVCTRLRLNLKSQFPDCQLEYYRSFVHPV